MKICTIGSGFVSQHLPYLNITEKIECNLQSIDNVLFKHKYTPDVLINCIGKTGSPNIDWCENNKLITHETNTILPMLLAEYCSRTSIKLIHIGSGCIYYGQSPNMFYGRDINEKPISVDLGWKETDFANPASFYSKTKYACDMFLESMYDAAVLRIRMPISNKNHPRNLINKLKSYDKVIDIPNSVTFMDDLVNCVDWVIKNNIKGIYHVTNPQTLTAAQIMKEYQKYVPEHQFKTIDEQELGSLTIAKRSNCVLDTTKLRNAGFQMSLAEDALKKCMAEYIQNI